MVVVLVILVLAAAAGAAYWLKTQRAVAADAVARDGRAVQQFGSVEIKTRSGACKAARKLVGHRLLAKDAPPLPLPSCTAAQCSCTFAKRGDRRTDARRILQGGLGASILVKEDRRTRAERRRAKQPKRSK